MPAKINIFTSLISKPLQKNIEQLEDIYKKYKNFSLADLLEGNADEGELHDNPIFIQLKKLLEVNIIFSQNPDKEELEILNNQLLKKVKEIGQLRFPEKTEILDSLKKAQTEIIGFVKQTQTIKTDEKRKETYIQAKEALIKADKEVLKITIKQKNNIKDIATLYKLVNPNIVGLARFFSLKEEIYKHEEELESNLTNYLNLLKDELKLAPKEDITLSSFKKIPEWSKFKLSLKKKFEENKRKKNQHSVSPTKPDTTQSPEEMHTFYKENQELIQEVSVLKEKITFLETQLATTPSIEDKSTEINAIESANPNIEASHSLTDQNDDKIAYLNNQLLQANEKNEQLTVEIGTKEKLGDKQQQVILNVHSELAQLKAELEIKEKQVAENLIKLDQNEAQLTVIENKLIQNTLALEKSTLKNKKLSEDVTGLSKALDEKNQSWIQTESELNTLKVKHNQIELLKTELESKLEQTEIFNTGILKHKQEEIIKLQNQIKLLKETLKKTEDTITNHTSNDNLKILKLEADINEKESYLKQLKNELENSLEKTKQFKKEIAGLKEQLTEKSQTLNNNNTQLKELTDHYSTLSEQKKLLDERYSALSIEYQNLNALSDQRIKALEKKLNLTENEKLEFIKKFSILENHLQKEKNSVTIAEQKNSNLETELINLQAHLTSTDHDLNSQLNQTNEEKGAINKKLEDIIKECTSFISQADKILFDISYDSEISLPSKQDLIDNFKEILKNLDGFKMKASENEKLKEEISKQILEHTYLNSDKEQLIAEIADLRQKNHDLKSVSKTLNNPNSENKESPVKNRLDAEFGNNSNIDDEEIGFSTSYLDEDEYNLDDDNEGENVNDKFKEEFITDSDPNKEMDPFTLFANTFQKLELTETLLAQKKIELQHKTDELEQLKKEFGVHTEQSTSKQRTLEEQIAALLKSSITDQQNISTLKSENESLAYELDYVQKNKKDIEEKISFLQNELKTNQSTNQTNLSLLNQQLSELEASNSHSENSIKTLQQLINEKNTNSKELADQIQQKNEALEKLQNRLSETLSNKQEELDTLRTELKEKSKNIVQHEQVQKLNDDQLSLLKINFEDLEHQLQTTQSNLSKIQVDLERANKTLAQSQKTSNEFSNENNKLKKDIEAFQKNYSDLQKKYGMLQEELDHKMTEQNVLSDTIQEIQKQLDISKQEVEILNKKIRLSENKTQSLEEQLQELKRKEDPMPARHSPFSEEIAFDTSLTDPKQDFDLLKPREQQSHSPSSSSITSSPDQTPSSSLEDLTHFPNPSGDISDKSQESSSDNLNNTHTLASSGSGDDLNFRDFESPENLLAAPLSENPNQQHIDSLLLEPDFQVHLRSELKAWLKTDFNEIFSTELNRDTTQPSLFPESELNKLTSLADHCISYLVRNDNTRTEIKEALSQIYSQAQDTMVLSPENAAKELLSLFKPDPLVYLGNYPQSNQTILKAVNDNKANAQQYAKLLNCLEEQCLSQKGKNSFKKAIQTNLANAFEGMPKHSRSEIEKLASDIADRTLNPENMLTVLEEAKINQPLVNSNKLIDTTKAILAKQCNKEIKTKIEAHFANTIITNILEKISKHEGLSDVEIQAIPLELQYAHSKKEFISGLRVKYPYLSATCENKIDEDNFKDLRLLLRKKSLVTINKTLPEDKDIIDLDTAAWLEKKLRLVTSKPINLEQIRLEKEQKNLLYELNSSLKFSMLYDIAITPKSTTELTKEIEKSNQVQLSVAAQINKIFSEVEIKQNNYPNLINDKDIPGFRANLNQHLENNSIALEITDEEVKILLGGINRRLKKDISKWNLLGNSLQKEITNDILTNSKRSSFKFDETETEQLVTHALSVLRENYANNTFKKREQWLKDIALLYATTKELAHFSQKIETNSAKFESLHALKTVDADHEPPETKSKITGAVYLPHSCAIVANSFDPNSTEALSSDFKVLDDAFYKQDALKPNQTLTFAQTLHNGEEQKWSVTRINETCLAYQIHKPWLNIVHNIKDGIDNTLTYVRSNNSKEFSGHEEVIFTQLTHAINSTKSPICTVTIGKNCSKEKEKFIRLVVEKFNERQRQSGEKTILINANDKLKIYADDKVKIYNKIDKAHSFTKKLDNQAKQTGDILKSHLTR